MRAVHTILSFVLLVAMGCRPSDAQAPTETSGASASPGASPAPADSPTANAGHDHSPAAANDPHAGHGDHAGQVAEASGVPAAPAGAPVGADGSGAGAVGDMAHGLEPGQYDPADVVAQPGASEGDLTTCPVSGEVFRVDGDSPHVTHEAHEIYFCCPRCIRNFQRNPGRYLSH